MRRRNFALAGIVDAAVILKCIIASGHAERLLTQEGLSRAVIDRVLGDDAFARRAQFRAPTSVQ
ncbi:hypothetical protein [Massilia sp. METH4]|uniref:hypothetical protein n=1 Tax=Massilia sp. METH4 TaxID=3123041 RepID=UPI0030CE54F1